MTTEEARKVISTLMAADGGCSHCAGELVRYFVKDFPDYAGLAEEMWHNEFGDDSAFREDDEG